MADCSSTTNQNTRVFAPHVILTQDTRRLVVNLKSGEGYVLPTFSSGDVIRYDPVNLEYKKSQADTEENAEVFGIVETASYGSATVVVSGSIKYPSARLSAIVDGGVGGKDILFLDDSVAGGLTGTIDLSTAGVKIVKPVMQVAPHGEFNGVVVNYVGYKTGNAAGGALPNPVSGGVIFGKEGLETDVWLQIDTDRILSTSDYPYLYSQYGTINGTWKELVSLGSGSVISGLVGKQIYQLSSGGAKQNAGTVDSVDFANNTITIQKTATTAKMDVTRPVYVDGIPYSVSVTTITHFTIPKIQSTQITQAGTKLVPYIKIYEPASITIPSELTISQLTVETTMTLGNISDLESKITELETKINLLNTRVSAF